MIFFECNRLASVTGPVPDDNVTVPIGVADVKRAGRDVTAVGLAYYVHEALAVADQLAAEGISLEVLDPRTLVPMDAEAIRTSVRKTGRLVVVDEAPATCSAASEIIALVTEDPDTFRALKAPVQRVCAAPVPVPSARRWSRRRCPIGVASSPRIDAPSTACRRGVIAARHATSVGRGEGPSPVLSLLDVHCT